MIYDAPQFLLLRVCHLRRTGRGRMRHPLPPPAVPPGRPPRQGSRLGPGSEAKPLVVIQDIDLKLMKGKAEDGYTMRLHCGVVKAEAEPVALRLGIRALTGLNLN